MRKIYLLALGLISLNSFAQIGVNTQNPMSTLDVSYSEDFVNANGVLTPRLTVTELESYLEKYGQPQNSILLFITEGIGLMDQTKNIKESGFYYYNAVEEKWFRLEREPWFSFENKLPASNLNDDIYQLSSVGIGNESIMNSSTILNISSDNKGIILPRLTKEERNSIISPSRGLLIFNTTSDCFNYYVDDNVKWLSVCGEFDPSSFELICDPDETGLSTQYLTQGTALNNIFYKIPVVVNNIGTYTILGTTGNGYSFSHDGNFVSLGNQVISVKGQGTPINPRPAGNEDEVSFKFNGVPVSPPANCPLKKIQVNSASTLFKIDCDSKQVIGSFNVGVASTNQNYIVYNISDISSPGFIEIRTETVNGVYFTTRSVNIEAGRTQLIFYPVGTPTQILNDVEYRFSFKYSNGYDIITEECMFKVDFTSNLGTYENPANRCLEIYNLGERTDGEYFMKSASGQPFKTYCDMTNGGYTLIRSTSEKAWLSEPANIENSLWRDPSFYTNSVIRNFTQAQGVNGTIVYENFQIPLAERKLVRSRQDAKNMYRVRIVENYSSINNNNDDWAKDNYMIFEFNGIEDFIEGDGFTYGATAFQNVTTTGKLFGKNYSAPYGYNTITFDNQIIARGTFGSYTSVYNQGYRGNGIGLIGISHGVYGSSGNASINHTFTYSNSNGSITSTNLKYIDQIFGFYNDYTINHHWGKCGSATADDYAGVQNCEAGGVNYNSNSRFPHSFNNGEGRYMQWFVK